ncbi:melatonin receptor type 1A-like [Clytia hemisphaerica]|uniref:melatonin receptor type 1A-like n=1 Tax=Clytia hemisphaerica TaxID=252671 RepID=UPI0034D5992D
MTKIKHSFLALCVILATHQQSNVNSTNHTSVILSRDMNLTNNITALQSRDCTNETSSNCSTISEPQTKKHLLNDRSTLPFYYVTIVLTIIGYSFVLPSAYKKRQPSSVFIFSLAFADFFIGFIVVPIKITEVYGSQWQKDIVWCRIVNAITIFGIALAGTNVVSVSIDRAIYFSYILQYKEIMTIKRAFLVCLASFFVSLPALFPAVGIGGQFHNERLEFCAFKFSLTRGYIWAVVLLYFVVPVILVLILQAKIMLKVNKYYNQHRHFIQANPKDKAREMQLQLSMKREMRVQRMFALIIIFFIVCWGPFVVGMVCNLVALHLITPFFIQLMRIMLFINSFINPLIMFLSSETSANIWQRATGRKRKQSLRLSSIPTDSSITGSTSELAASPSMRKVTGVHNKSFTKV